MFKVYSCQIAYPDNKKFCLWISLFSKTHSFIHSFSQKIFAGLHLNGYVFSIMFSLQSALELIVNLKAPADNLWS